MDPLVLTAIGQLLGTFTRTLGVWPTVTVICCAMACATCLAALWRAERYERQTAMLHRQCIDRSERFAKQLLRPILLKLKRVPPGDVDAILDELLLDLDRHVERARVRRAADGTSR